MMRYRHLDYGLQTPVAQLGLAALDDLLDRGDLDDWAPLARAVAADPHGVLAERVLRLVDAHPMYGTSRLWRTWIERLRDCRGPRGAPPAATLRDLRQRAGLTQRQVAARMGVTQPDLSRLERRGDVKLSSLRGYTSAAGATLRLVADSAEGEVELVIDAKGLAP
ncbi:MAG: helix-turn-helix domain-containing protein [Egibacteraceae bacterium]